MVDPTQYIVAFAGLTYDWILSRPWWRAHLFLLPFYLLIFAAGAAWWGQTIDRRELSSWYLSLGEEEISGWQETWDQGSRRPKSSEAEAEDVPGSDALLASAEDAEVPLIGSESEADAEIVEKSRISGYADMLFRRAQMLVPSERCEFYIAARLAQRGAIEEAIGRLQSIAPLDGEGYPDAHAFLALIGINQMSRAADQNVRFAMAQNVAHHIGAAVDAKRVPQDLLIVGSDFLWQFSNTQNRSDDKRRMLNLSLNMLSQAAETDPSLKLELAKRSAVIGNEYVRQQSLPDAEEHFGEMLEEDPKDETARIGLAEVFFLQGDIDQAEHLIREGMDIQKSEKLRRALSEIYRKRFRMSLKERNGVFVSNIRLLNFALEADPTNPNIGNDIALLARLNSPDATQELINKLKDILATGTATPIARKWLAETYLMRQDYGRALPHLEQVVSRMPSEHMSRNNLAFVLAELSPERLEEAREHAKRAIMDANTVQEPNADYYDTLGSILMKLGDTTKAITSYETAIQLKPKRVDFHERIVEAYRATGKKDDAEMADRHEKQIVLIKERLAAEAAAENAAPDSETDEASEVTPPNSDELNSSDKSNATGEPTENSEESSTGTEDSPSGNELQNTSGPNGESDANSDDSSETVTTSSTKADGSAGQ